MTIEEILRYLPHRYPMLMVDRILEVEPGVRCVGIKNVTVNEGFFQGHYPGRPIMPGVLIVEAMAQTGAVILLTDPKFEGLVPLIGGVENVRFRKQVIPGDTLTMTIELLKLKGKVGKIHGEARVEGDLVAEMDMTFMFAPKEQ